MFFMIVSAIYTSGWWAVAMFDAWKTPAIAGPIIGTLVMLFLLVCSFANSFEEEKRS
jgi:hypothetical protein